MSMNVQVLVSTNVILARQHVVIRMVLLNVHVNRDIGVLRIIIILVMVSDLNKLTKRIFSCKN